MWIEKLENLRRNLKRKELKELKIIKKDLSENNRKIDREFGGQKRQGKRGK